MTNIVEKLFPGIIDALCSRGFARELVSNSLNGMVKTVAFAGLAAVLLFFFRDRILSFIKRLGERRAFSISLIVLSVLSLPDPIFPMHPGLDYSWQWMLNQLAFSREWGSSVVFTYGPLGWLLYPSGSWGAVLIAIAANICFCVLWVWSLQKIYDESDDGRAMAWGLLLTMFFPQLTMEWRWVVLAVVLTRVSYVVAGVVSAFIAMMKFSSIVMALGTQVSLLIFDKNRRVIAYLSGFVVTFTLLASFYFSSPVSFWTWLTGSVQVASGYNKHMILDKGLLELSVPFFAFAIVAFRPRMFFATVPLAPFLFCSAKYAWIRQGFLPFLYVCTILAAFLAERFETARKRLFITSVSFILIALIMTLPWYFAGGMTYVAFPFGVNPMGIVRTLIVSKLRPVAITHTNEMLNGCKFPEVIRNRIGSETVQILGHEFAPAMGDTTINLIPYATMQLYSTYTAKLDEMAAHSYFKSNTPTFVVIDTANIAIDGKNPFLDSPRTWAALRANYSLDRMTDNGRWMLLRRRRSPIEINFDKTVTIPEMSVAEKVLVLLFRGKFQFSDVESGDGGCRRFRINPLVLCDPIDRNLPVEIKDLAKYFND